MLACFPLNSVTENKQMKYANSLQFSKITFLNVFIAIANSGGFEMVVTSVIIMFNYLKRWYNTVFGEMMKTDFFFSKKIILHR